MAVRREAAESYEAALRGEGGRVFKPSIPRGVVMRQAWRRAVWREGALYIPTFMFCCVRAFVSPRRCPVALW